MFNFVSYTKTCETNPSSFGSEDRNQYTGPRYFDTDANILKTIPVPHWERGQMMIGVQFFNILNHPNFGTSSNDIADGANFGQITSTVSTPTASSARTWVATRHRASSS